MDDCPLYTDPELYDLLFPDVRSSAAEGIDEVRRQRISAAERFYLKEAQRNQGRVLELACGSGRLAVPIAQTGREVVGLDLSHSMLEAARAKASAVGVQVQWVQGNMSSFDLGGQFSTVLIAGNSLLHLLSREDLKHCLSSVRRHLVPDGRLIFDVFNPDVRQLARNSQQRYPLFKVKHPQRGQITLEETAVYDALTQVRNIRWYFSSPEESDFRVIDYSLRVIFPEELLLLLESARFRLQARFGEFTREPFTSSTPRQLCICSL